MASIGESAEFQRAEAAATEEKITRFLDNVRGVASIEEALKFCPGTTVSLMAFLKPDELKLAEEKAAARRETWRVTVEAIRNASTIEEARAALGERAQELGPASLWAAADKLREQKAA